MKKEGKKKNKRKGHLGAKCLLDDWLSTQIYPQSSTGMSE